MYRINFWFSELQAFGKCTASNHIRKLFRLLYIFFLADAQSLRASRFMLFILLLRHFVVVLYFRSTNCCCCHCLLALVSFRSFFSSLSSYFTRNKFLFVFAILCVCVCVSLASSTATCTPYGWLCRGGYTPCISISSGDRRQRQTHTHVQRTLTDILAYVQCV